MGIRILITGGAGYVGSVLTESLLAAGHAVTILDNNSQGDSAIPELSRHRELRLVRGDICNPPDLAKAAHECEAVIHLAALVGFPICREQPSHARHVIVDGTSAVCQAFRDKPIIYASTGSVYGDIEYLCSEDSPCNPVSEYGKFKLAAENIVREYGGVSLRFATLFGLSPCMRFDLLPNAFTFSAVRRGHLILYRGSDRRTFLHVRDAARAYLMALLNFSAMRGEAYNVGDESLNMSKRDLARAVKEIFPMQILDEESLGSDPDLRNYEVSYEKFRKATGFAPAVDFDEGLREVGKFASVADVGGKWRIGS